MTLQPKVRSARYARDDATARDGYLGKLNAWQFRGAALEAAFEQTRAASEIKEIASSTTISRSDAILWSHRNPASAFGNTRQHGAIPRNRTVK